MGYRPMILTSLMSKLSITISWPYSQKPIAVYSVKELPILAFVGTHLDQQDSCPKETTEQKDELHSMITEILPEELQECIISNGKSLTEVTFRVNRRKD